MTCERTHNDLPHDDDVPSSSSSSCRCHDANDALFPFDPNLYEDPATNDFLFYPFFPVSPAVVMDLNGDDDGR